MDHKISHTGHFFKLSWINKLSIDVWFATIGKYTIIWKSGIWGCKNKYINTNKNIEKITFKAVQIKSLATHITNKKRVLIYWQLLDL